MNARKNFIDIHRRCMHKKIAIIPIYNEELKLLEVLSACVKRIDLFILINDGSNDKSLEIIQKWKTGKTNVHLINSTKNRGMSWAVKQGFKFVENNKDNLKISDNDIIVQIDADAQHSIEKIDDLTDYMNKNKIDYLITRRQLMGYPLIKIIGNHVMSLFASLITLKRFYDIESGYRLVRVKVIPQLLKYTVGFQYSWAQEMAVISVRLGFKTDNTWQTETQNYRIRGTKIKDALINCFFSSLILHTNFLWTSINNFLSSNSIRFKRTKNK